MAGKKLSGAMLAAELSSLPDREFNPPIHGPQDGLQEPATQEPGRVLSGREDGQPSVTRRTTVSSKSRGGRPSKAGVDGIPVNVRLSQGDHLALAKLSTKLMTPGRPAADGSGRSAEPASRRAERARHGYALVSEGG